MFFNRPDLPSDALRARHREKMLRNGAFLAVLAAFVCLFVLMFVPSEPALGALKTEDSPRVSAIGGTWKVEDLQWTQVGDKWRVQAYFMPSRVRIQGATKAAILNSMCGAILTALPGKPDGVSGREAVYRVDANAQMNGGDVDPEYAIFDAYVSVVVQEGACQVSDASKRSVYAPHYPGLLEGWSVTNGKLRAQGEGKQLELTFIYSGQGTPDLKGFPYFQACQLAMDDERIDEVVEKIGARDTDLADLPIVEVKVSARKQAGNSLLNFSWGSGAIFVFSNGQCVAHGPEQTL